MILLTTNHKVGDVVYVVTDCVRRGIVQAVNFAQGLESFTLSYDILYDGFTFTKTVTSELNTAVREEGSLIGSPIGSPTGSPLITFGSPFGSPSPATGGSPSIGGSPLEFVITIVETANGGNIFIDKDEALEEFGKTLA